MKSLKDLIFIIVLFSSTLSIAHQWEFQFRIVNNSGQYQQMTITIYRYDSVSKDYVPLGSGSSSTTQSWENNWNAIVNISGISGDDPNAIMTIPLYTIYVIRIGNDFKKIEYGCCYDESFYYNTDTGSFTTGGNYSVTASGTWNNSYSILLKNNFAGGDMWINSYRETSIPADGFTRTREATTFPHTLTAIDNQQPGSYKMLWDKWSDTYPYLNRTLSYAQSFDKTANFNKEYKVTFRNYYGSAGSTGGVIKVRSSQVNSPSVDNLVTQYVAISAEALNQTINYVDLTIDYWSDNLGTSASVNPTPTDHKTYTAYLKGKPNNGYRNLSFNTNQPGQPVHVTWSDHPDTDVNEYQIWRKVKQNGVWGSPTLLTTVGRNVQSYTDNDYLILNNGTQILLMYDVRAHYNPNNAYADVSFEAVYGELNISMLPLGNNLSFSSGDIPETYKINNFPNPFNPMTIINYQLPENGFVTIKVYDMLGKEVAILVNENKPAGYHRINFDASKLTSGVYVYTITVNNFIQSKKMLLMK